MLRESSMIEMGAMAAVSVAFSLGVVYVLAIDDDPTVLTELEFAEEGELAVVAKNVLDVALPKDATDVISIALGEAIGGIVAAIATFPILVLIESRMQQLSRGVQGAVRSSAPNTSSLSSSRSAFVTEAVADGDFFVTRAAALPLLEALGLPSFVASIGSVLLATIPYELTKVASRQRQKELREARLLEELLREEEARKVANERQRPLSFLSSGTKRPSSSSSLDPLRMLRQEPSSPMSTAPVARTVLRKSQKQSKSTKDGSVPIDDDDSESAASLIDVPEIFADITKWLEYDVLKKDFGGKLFWNGQILSSPLESAAFGFVAALSSQLYQDVLYYYTDSGPRAKRDATRERSVREWAQVYSSRCFSAATLFGVYEAVRRPVSKTISGILAGGVDGCLGSTDFEACVETYMLDNPAEASPEAQLRSLLTAVVSLYDRMQNDVNFDTDTMVRGLAVQLYNIVTHMMDWTITMDMPPTAV